MKERRQGEGKTLVRTRPQANPSHNGGTRVAMAASQASGETALSSDPVVIRHCQGLEELRACVTLQKEVWNFTDAELVPLRMFVVAGKRGGAGNGGCSRRARGGVAPSVAGRGPQRKSHPP